MVIDIVIRVAVFLAEAAIGLLVAALVVPGFSISPGGFALAVAVFGVIQSLAASGLAALSRRYAPVLVVASGLVATFVALVVATLVPGGLAITGVPAWLWSSLLVWLVTSAASWLLRRLILRDGRRR